MGGTVSLQPEIFSLAKEEYETKKNAGLTDEELFNHMKTFIETKTAEYNKTHHKEGEHHGHKEGEHHGGHHGKEGAAHHEAHPHTE